MTRAGDELLVAYAGDECLGVRTASEWAELRGCKVSSVLFKASPAGHRRAGDDGIRYYRQEADE